MIRYPPLRPYQKALIRDPARDVLCVSATQIGKTYVLAAWLVGAAVTGRRCGVWWWLAPTFSQIAQGFRYCKAFTASAGLLAGVTMSPFPVIKLVNGAIIEFRSWEREQNLAGTTIDGGVVDEAGLLTGDAQAIISTRRSSTLGPLRYIGNPGIVAGPFRRLCSLGEDAARADSEWRGIYSFHRWSWADKHSALLETDPQAAADYERFIEQERASIPEFEFRRLYEAEWTEDEAAVFRGVGDCLDGNSKIAADTDRFVLGVDVGQVVDYLAVVSLGRNTRRLELRDRFRGIPYPQAAERIKALQESMNGAPCVLEVNGAGVALEQEFRRCGVKFIPFTTTSQSKQEIVLALAADIASKRVKIAEHSPMPYELERFRYERMPSGVYRYSAPSGEHDDTVMAACLARYGIGHAIDLRDYGWMA